MDHAQSMGRIESTGYVNQDGQGLASWHGSVLGQPFSNGGTGDEFHGQERRLAPRLILQVPV